jgi:D-serine deaminase-like pyridoxal phosphate-dependent protein
LAHLQQVLGDVCTGFLTYSARESACLANLGMDDFWVAYPIWQRAEIDAAIEMARRGKRLVVTVDSEEALERLDGAARNANVEFAVAICVDLAVRALSGRVHLGAYRSPVHSPHDLRRLARAVRRSSALQLHGLLAYEAHVAGLPDRAPLYESVTGPDAVAPGRAARAREALVSAFKHFAMAAAKRKRAEFVSVLHEEGFGAVEVNGGGTGSFERTAEDPTVTEVSVGSAFFKPHLFDRYGAALVQSLEPACFFALEATRRPDSHTVTCLGGGYSASGPAGPDRLPVPVWPPCVRYLDAEGAGEVQTPFRHGGSVAVALGDVVLLRHAKAGEVCERFSEVLVVGDNGGVEAARTYRGLGWTFF